jgi:Tol biopolymer transport system component
MGAVYRATDTKLNRDVAIKVLPDAFAADPDRLARFTREAQVLAALNHPNIAAIYGVEDRALVMELVEGENLKPPLPVETAIAYAKQIAEALEAAHEKGIIHRDLKPANIKVTPQGTIKVLDFGLAAVTQGGSVASGNPQSSPTLTMMGATQAGLILGTASYMSPEQAAGKPVDRRGDIWSFGVVLWEMVTGKRLFDGESVSHTLADVLRAPIDFDSLPKETPASVKTLLKRCLDRNVRNRLRDIGEARVALENAGQAPEAPAPRSRGTLPWIAAALAVIAAGLGYVAFRHSQEEAPRVAKVTVLSPEKGQFVVAAGAFAGPPAVSPDGRHIAFIANVDGKTGLWIRDLDSPTPRLLAGTEGAISPFWSPDSRYVGFGADGKLKKIDITGGPPLTICDAPSLRGGAWNKNDVIVFNPTAGPSGLFRVSAAGGTPTPVTELDKSRNESSDRHPWFLPDGRHFLYMGRSREPEKTAVFVGDLESPAEKQARKRVVSGDTTAVYAAATGNSAGYLLFMRDRTLMAQPFNAEKLATSGEAVPVAEQVDHSVNLFGVFGVSQTGVLAYMSGGASGGVQITWFDRSGRPAGTVGPRGTIGWASLSPDGTTVATDPRDGPGVSDLWLHDLTRGATSRFTFGDNALSPIWSPDGARIIFNAPAKNGNNMFVRNANQTGQEEVLGDSPAQRPTDWSRDGRYIIADQPATGGIWVHPQFGDKKPFAYGHPGFRENDAKLSPDGKWLAYMSNESKRNEIYVLSFPTPEGGKFQISTDGGRIPVWSRDGRELYFISANNKMMAVKINTAGGKFQASVPQPLFDIRMSAGTANFDVSKDGRFLIPTVVGEASNVPMTVVLNWQAGLQK